MIYDDDDDGGGGGGVHESGSTKSITQDISIKRIVARSARYRRYTAKHEGNENHDNNNI